MKCYIFGRRITDNIINMSKSDTIQLAELIRNRKSTFVNGLQEGGRIADNVIEEILNNAVWAPSHGLVQAWEFLVFADSGVESFFKKQQRIYKESTPPQKFNETKYRKYTEKSNKVSHVIAVISRRDSKRRFPKQEDVVSVACTVQNIYLSMNAYGIGGYLSTGNICYTKQMREFLKLGKEDECLGFFILGLPDPEKTRPERKRVPASEKTQWIRD